MNFENYINKLEYPRKPSKPTFCIYFSSSEARHYAAELEKYEEEKKIYNQKRDEYNEETHRLHELFKQDLFDEFDVTNNPKREKCFELAWSNGHACGLSEVYNYFSTFVELIV